MSARLTSPTLVGRREELVQLRAALERAAAGDPTLVLVGGDAGVGKTRLLEAFAERAREDGALTATGGCLDLGEGVLAFSPLEDALRDLERTLGSERFVHLLRGPGRRPLRALLGPSMSADAPGPAPGDPTGQEQGPMLHAVQLVLDELTADQPVVLVVEDLHWADRSTLDLVTFLARRLRSARVLVVGSYRTDELHRRHPLRPVVAELIRVPGVERLELAPLARPEVIEQLTRILGEPPSPALVDEVVGRSGGNPFYVEELLAWHRADGGGALPPALSDVLAARLDRMPSSTRQVLRVAAVAGPEVDQELVAAVAQVEADEVADALRDARERLILRTSADGRTLRFRHALLREAAYDELLPNERTAIHRAVAEILADRPELTRTGGRAAALAHHWHAAHELDRAFLASREAARAAADVYAYAEAQHHAERALELWGQVAPETRAQVPPRWQLLREAAEHAARRGASRRAVAHLRAALDDADDVSAATRAGLLSFLGFVLWKRGDERGSLEASQQAMRVVPSDEASPELATVLAGHATRLLLLERHEEAVPLAEQALEVALAVGARSAESEARNTLGAARSALGETASGIEQLERARQVAESAHDVHLVMRAYVNLVHSLVSAGRLEDAVAWGEHGLAWAHDHELEAAHTQFLMLNHINGLWLTGRWERADAVVDAVGEVDADGVLALHQAITVGRLRAWQGRLDEAQASVGRLDAVSEEVGPQFDVGSAVTAAEVALLADDRDRQRVALERLQRLEVGAVFHVERLLGLRAWLAADLARADTLPAGQDDVLDRVHAEVADARDVLDQVDDRGAWPAIQLAATIQRAEAELGRGRGEPDPEAWAAALAAARPLGEPHHEAYLRWRYAEALVAADGDREAAEAELTRARATAEELGARPLLERIDDLARRARVPLPGMAAQDGVEALGLTPREHEVLVLVAEGRTNREIGEALFISQKTASVHVSNILGKLGVDDRHEAAAVADRLGIG